MKLEIERKDYNDIITVTFFIHSVASVLSYVTLSSQKLHEADTKSLIPFDK